MSRMSPYAACCMALFAAACAAQVQSDLDIILLYGELADTYNKLLLNNANQILSLSTDPSPFKQIRDIGDEGH